MPEWFDTNLSSVLNGLAIGCLLFLVASGLSLVFGMMDVLNLAHGAVFLLGAYVAYAIIGDEASWPAFVAALVAAPLAGAACGGILAGMTRPLAGRGHLDQALLTLGCALVLADLIVVAFGKDVHCDRGSQRARRQRDDRGPGVSRLPAGADRRRHCARPRDLPGRRAHAPRRPRAGGRRRSRDARGDGRRLAARCSSASSRPAARSPAFAGALGAQIYGARPGLEDSILLLALVVVVIGGLGLDQGRARRRARDRTGGVARPRTAARTSRRSCSSAPWGSFCCSGLAGYSDRPPPRRDGGRAVDGPRVRRRRAHAAPQRRRHRGRRRSPRCCSSLAPFALDPASLGTLGRIIYFALLAASLDLFVGITGLPSLAHAGFFAVGAYAAGLVAKDVSALAIVVLPAAVLVAGFAAAITGWLAVRSRGIFFLMLTLAIGEIIFLLAESAREVTGGSNGMFGIPLLEVVPGSDALSQPALKYWFVFAIFWIGFGVLWAASRSPFGLALRGIHDNEERMRALGYSPRLYKFGAFCLAGAVAGLAGALLAAHQQGVTPADAAFGTAVVALVSVIIGGAGTLWGPCLGAAVVVARPRPDRAVARRARTVAAGPGVHRGGVPAPGRDRRRAGQAAQEPGVTPLLELRVGLAASSADCVRSTASICACEAGARHGLIGPNGAGKSTLFKLILGAERVSDGQVHFDGHDITACRSTGGSGSASRRRSSTRACSRRSRCADNVRLALQRRTGEARRPFGRRSVGLGHAAGALLARVGLDGCQRRLAASLSHGERRQLEVAIALAAQPRLLLLDEPAAGMSPPRPSGWRRSSKRSTPRSPCSSSSTTWISSSGSRARSACCISARC